jgi:diguanylate cyclase (GGDEF)-like protein
VDQFKIYNETYGHSQGDVLLKALGQLLDASAKRPMDIAARLEGGEFGILLPDTALEGALELAERIRLAVEETRVPSGESMTSVTISAGVITLIPSEDISAADMIVTAKTYLKTAKSKGGNQIYNE